MTMSNIQRQHNKYEPLFDFVTVASVQKIESGSDQREGFRSRTPAPPPFSSMNAPAYRHLFRAFAPPREPHSHPATVLWNEFYASLFERPHKSLDGAILRAEFAGVGLEPLNTRQGHSGRLC